MRIGRSIDESTDRIQHAYMKFKITTGIRRFHMVLIALNLEMELDFIVDGIELSKAFDTVNRVFLMKMFKEYTFETNCSLL